MKLHRGLFALALLFTAAQSCTNDFDQFDLNGTGGRASGGKSSVGGSSAGTTVGTAGKGGTSSGGSSGSGGIANTAGETAAGGSLQAGATGMAGAAGAGCAVDQKDCGSCVALNDPATGCGDLGDCAPCNFDHASASCDVDNVCAMAQCDAGYDDCNTQASDGCEVNLAITPAQCGSCSNSCTAQGLLGCANAHCTCTADSQCGNNNPGVDCVSGLCECDNVTCLSGERCSGSGGDPRLCSCNGGSGCTGPSDLCCQDDGCVDSQTSATNCGNCGRACTAGFICALGSCACDSPVDCGAESSGTGGAPGVAGAGGNAGDTGVGSGGAPASNIECTAGLCVCNGTTCGEGQRCQPDGSCG